MKRFKRIILVAFTLVFVLTISVLSFPKNTKAYSEDSTAWKKAIGTAIRQCYEADALKSPITMEEYDFDNSALSWGNTLVQVPNLNGNSYSIECYKLFNQYISWPNGDPNTKATFLTNNLGYKKTDGQPTGECFYFRYDYEYDDKNKGWEKDVPTDYICADTINADGTIGVDKMTIRWTDHDYGGSSFNVEWENHKEKITIDCYVQNIGGVVGSVSFKKNETKWSDFKAAVKDKLLTSSTCVEKRHSALLGGYTMHIQPNFLGTESAGDVTSVFTIEDKTAAAAKATNYILGQTYNSNPTFTVTDTFSLYQAYVTEYYNADIICGDMTTEEKTVYETKGYSKIAVYSDGAMKANCYAKAQDNKDEISSGAEGTFGDFRTFEQICAWMAANYSSVNTSELSGGATTREPDEPIPDPGDDNPDDGVLTEAQQLEEACYRESKSLGWIICPIIFGLQEASSRIYEKIEPMVRVNDSVLGQLNQGNQGQGSMFKAWNTFRGIANVIFVILFLFIIFSQLTGFGIDNYGIKKMLPKVIVTAILVNISFLICAVAVDISNVLGKSLQDLLVSLAPSSSVMGSGIVEGTTSTINAAVNIIFIFATAGAGAVAFFLEGWALIIPILLFLLTMIISIIFALIVLGLRQAFVVILVVVSPIAFACTLLPNTDAVFKKWKEFFKQILMVYPIVGGLIGAGYFVARLIWVDNTDLIMTITAGMLCVAPYFLVPSLTRKSLDMAGKLGERLQGFGRNANRRVNDFGRSDAVRNARANSRAGRDESRAQRWMNSRRAQKIQDDMAAGKTISRRRANKYAQKAALATQSRQASIAARSAQSQYGRLSSSSGYQAAMSAANMAEDATTTKNFETMLAAGDYKYTDGSGREVSVDSQNNNQIAAALEHELAQSGDKYDANKVRALTNALASKGKEGRNLMFDAVKNAQNNGASSQAIKDFSGNIMSNHAGTMKEKHRSLYEFAKSTAGMEASAIDNSGANNISRYAASGVGSLNASDMTNMDIQQLQRYRENVSSEVNPKTGKSDQQILAGLANDALTDEHLSQNLSDKTRTELQKIAQMGGYSPVTPQPSDLKVDHTVPAQTEAAQAATANAATVNAEAVVDAARARAAGDNGRHALDEYTESVIRRVESGDIKADDGERMIQHAEEHIRNKYGNGGKA